MTLDHATVVAFSKTWGLVYLIALFVGAVAYALWPGNRKQFHEAKDSILDEDDRPWR